MKTRTFVTARVAMAALLVCLLWQRPVLAQGVGTILGTVTDPSGGVVPNAKVKVTNQATSLTRETQTTGQGFYTLPALPAATYSISVEAPGFVAINRFRESPHPKVTFANDFSRRLEPQPGMRVVYARTRIDSDRDQVKKLSIGYSDDVSVFLNDKILFRGRSAQNFRDPAFLGIVSADDDAVYLPLKKGSNELILAVSELGGGWGFICRLTAAPN